jgi:lipooligosaccharide transport system ATP-binding protein
VTTPAEPVIRVQHVRKSYGSLVAVKSLSFAVEKGTCFGLLGPNGAGKTTMMKMIYAACLRDRDAAAEISVFGYNPATDELAIKNLSGVVPQDDNLDTELSVLQNLRVYSRLYGLPREVAESRIDELLHFMELGEKRLVKIRELSGGMKRRLIIARALLNKPRLLILDEPTTGLDPQVRHQIWDKLRQLKAEGLTILLTTHYMEEAFQICDTVLIMHRGESVMEGPPRGLLGSRIERYVLEVRGRSTLPAADGVDLGGVRVEESAHGVRVFCQDHGRLGTIAAAIGGGDLFIRETNLEDLFLQATGSTLDE